MSNLPWGTPTNIPDDRAPLKQVVAVSGRQIGEGTLVRARAFFMHANYSNTSSGEAVNCGRPASRTTTSTSTSRPRPASLLCVRLQSHFRRDPLVAQGLSCTAAFTMRPRPAPSAIRMLIP
jgi:hypothetical protein